MVPLLQDSPLFLSPPFTLLYPSTPLSLHIPSLSPRRLSSFSCKATNNNASAAAAIVWYKHDLRVDDHPALFTAASSHPFVLPLYIFDRRILSRFSDEVVELLLLALEDLRSSLKEQGSNLMIRFGNAEDVLRELVKEVKATKILAEEEVEYDLRLMIDVVKNTLAADPSLNWHHQVELWRAPFYDVKNLDDLPMFFRDLKKPQFDDNSLLGVPRLPSGIMDLDWGHLPILDDVCKFMDRQSNEEKEQWYSMKEISAESVLRNDHLKLVELRSSEAEKLSLSSSGNNSQDPGQSRKKRVEGTVFGTRKGSIVAGGTKVVLNALAAYLRYLEGTSRYDWQEVHQKLRETESRNGASFGALFGSALLLGILSRRRVHYEALKYEKERNAGFLSPFGYSTTTVAAAVDTVCSIEWYWLLSLKSQSRNDKPYCNRLWRWNGHLIQYTMVGFDGPPVLLVHGFGAFHEHYRDNLCNLASGGNRVWAVTLLGFGESEKPNVVYTELMWAELLRDFIIEVVGEPTHLVGNSIGGYFVSIVGGLWPCLVKSIVLLNTAGDVIPGYSSLLFFKERQLSGAAWLGARALLQYLRLSTGSLVKNCYPTRPERADDWLINEMLRASYDPGSVEVMESIFSFNLSIPLDHLLAKLKDRVMIVQGMRDPIADSSSKLAKLREHCAGIMIKELDAGHCPHDECPEIVNSTIQDWIMKKEKQILP